MLRIAIIGAGIGGLTTAASLRLHGLEAQVYERRSELKSEGSGLLLPCNAMQVFNRLGIGQAVVDSGNRIDLLELLDHRNEPLRTTDLRAFAERHKAVTVAITRARLHAILVDSLPFNSLHFGSSCKEIRSNSRSVCATFANGGQIECDLLIGADGLQSSVRGHVREDVKPRYSGQSSYRGIASFDLPMALRHTSREFWGPGRRAGFVPLRDGEVYWFATFNARPGETESAGEVGLRLADLAASFPEPLAAVISQTRQDDVLRTDTRDLPAIDWSRNRVLLIGDAAHATTPDLGQGGAQAIEDGFALAKALSDASDTFAALRIFEAARRPKANLVAKRSRQIGKLAHLSHPVAIALRNRLIRSFPERLARKHLDSMFSLTF
jgi:2-polyprenyl-6-methoxyphenol hydroxylase-like FAD-dependent oxidoreductase